MFNYLKIIFSFKKHVSTLSATHVPHHIKQLTIYESPQGPQSHNLMTEGRGGGFLSDFLGTEILAKSDFFGSMKDAGIFLGHDKKKEGFFFGCEEKTS